VLTNEPQNRDAAQLLVAAHDALLASGGDESFWEQGWLVHERARFAKRAET
jgi:hypothetical protein